jgi:hypothetical protein
MLNRHSHGRSIRSNSASAGARPGGAGWGALMDGEACKAWAGDLVRLEKSTSSDCPEARMAGGNHHHHHHHKLR